MLLPVRFQEEHGLLATFAFRPQPQSTTKTINLYTQISSFDREVCKRLTYCSQEQN